MAWKGGSIAGEYRQADSLHQHSAASWQGSLCDCVGEARLGVALSQLAFPHQARGAGSLWAQLFSHLVFAA